MAFLLSTALIVIGMGWFAFGGMTAAPPRLSPVWSRRFASLLVIMGVLTLSLDRVGPWF